jgi:hypothetical protein
MELIIAPVVGMLDSGGRVLPSDSSSPSIAYQWMSKGDKTGVEAFNVRAR